VFALDLGMFTLASSTAIFFTGYLLDTMQMTARDLGWLFSLGSLLPVFLWGVSQLRYSRSQPQKDLNP